MLAARLCRFCKTAGPGRPVTVREPRHQLDEWHICYSCWPFLELGFRQSHPEEPIVPRLDPGGLPLSAEEVRLYIRDGMAIGQRGSANLKREPVAATQAGDRYLTMLEQLFELEATSLEPAMRQAAQLMARTLGADKADAFFFDPASDSLVARGISNTSMGRRQVQLGLDRLPLAAGGLLALAFQSGTALLSENAAEDGEIAAVTDGLDVRSEIVSPLRVGGETVGVLAAASRREAYFSQADLQFLNTVAHWVGIMTHRAELAETVAAQAYARGKQQVSRELDLLTRRQQEVAACIAEGLTNDEIAERLFITPGTAANHTEAILRRLGLRNRTQIATWAVQHSLYSLKPGPASE